MPGAGGEASPQIVVDGAVAGCVEGQPPAVQARFFG